MNSAHEDSGPSTKQLDSYALAVTPMELSDVPNLRELSVSVGWPHRPEDWEMIIGLGRGIVARDEIGRIHGSAMWFPMGDKHAAIGMVITTPRLQDLGAGRWLMGQILGQIGERSMLLNATRAAFRLYISLGFTPLSPSYQHNGVVTVIPPGPDHARPMQCGDHDAVHALDTAAMGFARPDVLARLFDLSSGAVVEQDGQVTGFALCRKFGRGHVVGPIVAETEADAIALVAHFVRAKQGEFLRVDTREPEEAFRAYLVAAGIKHIDTVTWMGLGPAPVPSGKARTYGLVSQTLG